MTPFETTDLPDYRVQSPAVADRFRRLKERPVVLEVEQLGRQFPGSGGPVTALRDVSLRIHRRELVCVIGPSVKNAAAIRAYEKVGFRALKQVRVPGETDPEFLMRITAAELHSLQS